MSARVAVLDIGSNSIKILVATRGAQGALEAIFTETVDARISAGISRTEPVLSEEGMQRGLAAIQKLLAGAAQFAPERAVLVATSAVRDARNGPEFRARVARATGFEIRILSGDEEANAIGRGLTEDPALADLQDFHVFDLGGGSLECLTFDKRKVRQALSLQLGCVRLTERFVADIDAPIPAQVLQAVADHTRAELSRAGCRFDLVGAEGVATGGTVTTVRAITGAKLGQTVQQTAPLVTAPRLRKLMAELAALPLEDRKRVPGLPAARADVMPVALATLVAVADAAGLQTLRHSFYNLRYGLAAELLQS